MRDSLDEALLRQMEKSILLDTVYDERRISEEAMQALLRERCVEALCAIRRALDADTQDAECFRRIEEIVKIYEAIGADGGARHDFYMKMVDYLKKALIYGHTSRISS